MSDPHEPPRPPGSDGPPSPPPPSDPYGGGAAGGGGYGPPDYGQPSYGQQPGQPPGHPTYGSGGELPGGLLDRFLARLIDFILLAIVTTLIDLAILAGALGMTAGSGLGVGGSYAYAAIAAVINTGIYLGYFAYLESSRGQTLGKMVMRLHVQTMAGGLPTLEQAARRNIWLALPLLGIVPVIGGVIGSLAQLVAVIMIAVGISRDPVMRRPWTDNLAETRVLKRTR